MSEVRPLIRLAIPVVLTQLGIMTMALVDLFMIGRLGSQSLAGAALGDLWVWGTFCIAMGVIMGLDPIVSQAHGAGDGDRAGRAVQRGIVVAIGLGIVIWILFGFTEVVMARLSGDPELAAIAQEYCSLQGWSIAPLLIFAAFRQYLQGRGIMRPALWTILAANLFNVVANEILIFGIPALPSWGIAGFGALALNDMTAFGVAGAGLATALTRCSMMLTIIAWIVIFSLHRGAWVPWRFSTFHWRGFREQFRFGVPIGLQIGAEVWAFQMASLFAVKLGPLVLAAHTVTLKLASTSFMIPLGIGAAAATRVGNLIGEGLPRQALRAAWTAIGLGATVMTICAICFVSLRHVLGHGFSEDPEVLALVATALPVAAAFQVFDGIQVTAAGALRGAGRTLVTGIAFLIGFWMIALPLGRLLGNHIGLPGIWWGLCIGLGLVAIALCIDLRRSGRRLKMQEEAS